MKATNLTFALRWSLLALVGALAASCSGDAPYYRVQVDAPDTVSLSPGENIPVELTLTRVADNSADIRLTLANAPQGITLLPEVHLPASEESVTTTLTLAIAPDVTTTGLVQTLLLAEDPTNAFAAGATFFIAVQPKSAPQPDFSIVADPRQANLYAGQSTQVPINITRAQGFTGPVTVTLEAPTSRVRADPLTIAPEETTKRLFIYTDRSTTRLPLVATVVATSEDGRKATTGLTINIR
ncbi:hypothetical protein JY651_31800 [Pyxidicoccus parkwayensis]|uniref:Lipoprotein n=1 Tax=Pyxidicoccus parkwayensis TaxID=2813578 RepID=A0ABX7NQQ3_9BACT|nr:hypothetical protein [Pyxidicoccus parkwaysis]QSQ19852.1 hypothetical protein JY651_31800 [Pyxidicoccus parkwaysis]